MYPPTPFDAVVGPEIKLFQTMVELNHRILMTAHEADRIALRVIVATLKGELIKLIDGLGITSEADVLQMQKHARTYAIGS